MRDVKLRKLKKTFVRQQDLTDCGVACLLSVIRYYNGDQTLESLREGSGTTINGTTLLGLYHCANKVGFLAEAFQASLDNLQELKSPYILHVIANAMPHYIVCYGEHKKTGKFIIGDPARGITQITKEDLLEIWQSRTLLVLSPSESFLIVGAKNSKKLRWFLSLLKDDITILSITMVIGIIYTLLGLATAVFFQKLIDQILPSGNQSKLTYALLLLVLILFCRSGLGYIRQHFLLLQSRSFNIRIINSFFKALIYLPKSFFDSRKTGDMIARMDDTSRIQKNIAYISGSLFVDLIVFFSTLFLIMSYSLILALIVFAFMPILVLIIFSFTKKIKGQQRAFMISNSVNESNYIDVIQGITVIKDLNKEQYFVGKVKRVYSDLQREVLGLGKLGNNFSALTEMTGTILTITLFSVSSFLVLQKDLKVGEMIAIVSLSGLLIPSVGRLSQIKMQFHEANIAFERMYDFASLNPEYEINSDQMERINFQDLKVEKVSFHFPGRPALLKEISFQIKKGEIIAILGKSGCGKSTTISLLQKSYSINSGHIRVNGIDLNEINTISWRNVISTVPQEIKLFNGTLLENIAPGNTKEDEKDVIKFCEDNGFGTFFRELPLGYLSLLGDDGINISGGQKQLVGLARSLYRNPQILILDEATSAMDRNTEKFIFNLLKINQKKMAIIIISHKAHVSTIAERLYIIDKGTIQDEGSSDELLKRKNFFTDMITDV